MDADRLNMLPIYAAIGHPPRPSDRADAQFIIGHLSNAERPGNVRQVPVEAVTRKDDGPIASILPEAESFMDVPIGPAQVRRTGHPESVL